MSTKQVISTALAAVALFSATEADAQNIDGSFRLALETNVLGLKHVALGSGPTSVGSTSTTVGLPGQALGVALGYGVFSDLLIGARLLASSTQTKIGDSTADATGFTLFPQAEYLFAGAVVRPFVSANLGYTADGSTGAAKTSTSTFLIGPGAGVHAFLRSSFSLDAGVMALFQKGTVESGGAELATTGYSVLLTVSLSGWLGGDSPTASAAPASPLETQRASDHGSLVVDEGGIIDAEFALDLPNTSGGVRVAIHGDPTKDPKRIKVIVTSLQSARPGVACGPLSFEAAGTRTELSDVQSSSRGGFGSALTTQAGSLAFDALGALTDIDRESWLTVCDERVLLLPAAKRRLERFARVFRRRLPADPL